MIILNKIRGNIGKISRYNIFLFAAIVFFLHYSSETALCSEEVLITGYYETVKLSEKGEASVNIELTVRGAIERLFIPCSYKNPENIRRIDGAIETALQTINIGGAELINYEGSFTGETGITVRYDAKSVYNPDDLKSKDFSNAEVKYSFINNSSLSISSFEVMIILPRGLAVNRVSDYSPRLKSDDPNEPYTLLIQNGLRALKLKTADMKYGGRASLNFKMKPEKHSPVLIFIFVIASIWYLFAFRDIINPREHKEPLKKSGEPPEKK